MLRQQMGGEAEQGGWAAVQAGSCPPPPSTPYLKQQGGALTICRVHHVLQP